MTAIFETAPHGRKDRALPSWLQAAAHGRSGEFIRGFGSPGLAPPASDPARAMAVDAEGNERASAAAQGKWSEGYEAGLAEGMRLGAERAALERAAADDLQLTFTRLDEAARAELADHLVRTVARLCSEVLPTAAFDEDAMRRRCKAAANALGHAPAELTLRLNPDDMALLPHDIREAWTVASDADLPRGALRVEAPDGGLADDPEEWARCLREALTAC